MRNTISYRFSRIHHALNVGPHLRVTLKVGHSARVLFQQSVIDSACGLHVFAMVLVILGVAKRSALEQMSQRTFGVAANVWRGFKETVFNGIDAREYVALIDTLHLPLHLRWRDQVGCDVDEFTLDGAMQGELIAVAFESIKNQRTRHWALCIGCEGSAMGRTAIPDTLLLLDPSASEPAYAGWNARLRMLARTRRQKAQGIAWRYESPDFDSEPVRLLAAVQFRVAK